MDAQPLEGFLDDVAKVVEVPLKRPQTGPFFLEFCFRDMPPLTFKSH